MEDELLEYWEDLEPKSPVHSNTHRNTIHLLHQVEHERNESETIKSLKQSIKDLESLHRLELKTLKNDERKTTIDTVQQALNSLQMKLQFQVVQAKQENEKMSIEITSQAYDLAVISQFLSDFEVFLTENRIKVPTASPPMPSQKFEAIQEQLKKEFNLVKITIQGMKEGIKKYRTQTESTNQKIAELKEFLANCRVKYEKDYKDFETSTLEQLKIAREENLRLKKECDFIKQAKLSELEQIEKRCSANNTIIENLQFELRSVKEILNHPVLKLRVHNKLQDYLADHNINSKPPVTQMKSQGIPKIKPMSLSQDFEFNFKSSVEEFSPFVSKLNLSSRKTSSTGTRTKLCRSIQFFNSYEGQVPHN